MTSYRAYPISTQLAAQVRASLRGPFGQPAEEWVSGEGRLPCRHCLGEVPVGRKALLLSYGPFSGDGPYAERGPVFLCADDCQPFAAIVAMPEIVVGRLVNIRAYDRGEAMLYRHSQVAAGGEAAMIVQRLLEDLEVDKVHIRTARNGCFLCAVERSS